MTQFKSRSGDSSPSAGILTYPVLQAADVLVYRADVVPVGDDRRQHIEITRRIDARFNNIFGDTFTLPRVQVGSSGSRIMGLDDPATKMSKSLAKERPGHAVYLNDVPDDIRRKIRRAVTDAGTEVRDDTPLGSGVANLIEIYRSIAGISITDAVQQFAGMKYGALKTP